MPGEGSKLGKLKDNGPVGDVNSLGYSSLPTETIAQTALASPRILDPRIEASKKSMSSITALKELVSI